VNGDGERKKGRRKSHVNTQNMVLFEKLIIILSRNSQYFLKPDGYLSCSKRSTAFPIPVTLHTLEVCLEQAMKAQRVSRGIVLLFLQPWC